MAFTVLELLCMEKSCQISSIAAMEGIQVFGATGSGKTSGPMRHMLINLFQNKCGGLVLCAKAGELKFIQEIADKTKRLDDIILLSTQKFDFVLYEAERPAAEGGGQTENILLSIMEIARIAGNDNGVGYGGDRFWLDAAKEYLRSAIDILRFTGKKITLLNIYNFIGCCLDFG